MKTTLDQRGRVTDAELWIGYGPVRDALRLRLTLPFGAEGVGERPREEIATLTVPYADAEQLARRIFDLLGLTPPTSTEDDPVVGHFTDD